MPIPAPPIDDDDATTTGSGGGNERLHRWVDILAALLSRRRPVSFIDLAYDVPEYLRQQEEVDALPEKAGKRKHESLKRAFERDKDELRALGIPIEVTAGYDEQGESTSLYQLRQTDFYLPYLSVVAPSGTRATPRRVAAEGYRALSRLSLEPDELAAVVHAAASIRSLGDTVLRADVESALRKLAVDLPLDQVADSPDVPRVISERVQPDAKIFAVLSKALQQRKSVSFTYHSMNADRTARRRVDPYGLFFTSGHWYLAGRDGEQNALRNFRLLRMLDAAPLDSRQATPDFEIPPAFSLREHARARQAWELGDDAPLDVLVSFHGESGQTVAAAALGQPVDDAPRERRFMVRRPDAFARWILSFAGEARIVSPASLAQQVVSLAAAARTRYDADTMQGNTTPSAKTPVPAVRRKPWEASSAAAKLKRLLLVMPQIADGEEHSLIEVAARIGCTVETLTDDLHSLAPRTDVPGGFIDKVSISITASTVSAESQHLRRPMRLTMSELCALDLGLAVLRTHRPPDEHRVLDSARRRLRDVIVALRDDVIPDALYNVSLGEMGSIGALAEVRDAVRQRRKLRIGYRKSGSTVTDERVVCPCALLMSHGMLYLVAHCDRSDAMRIFRMDRVADALPLDDEFTPAGYDLDEVARDGRVFMGGDHDTMLVRYSPKIARWIAERERRTVADDGSLVLDHPLADVEWAVRHVLQYGPDAEVLSPPSLRARLRQTLDAMSQ